MSLTVRDLSPDQREAYDSILNWADDTVGADQPLLTLGGYAGSGKSTLVSLVAEQIDLPAFCAYTGKAASVLKRKLAKAGIATVGTQKRQDGLPSSERRPYCGTIHSLIYRPCACREPQAVDIRKPCPAKDCVGETMWLGERGSRCSKGHVGLIESAEVFEALKPTVRFMKLAKVDGRCPTCGDKQWLRRDVLDREYTLIIVDEASMVDDTMLRDLRSYGVPILAVGDHGQLPPVGGSGSLMKSPMLRLEKIHRQAEGNPIIALSKIIRETGLIPESFDLSAFDPQLQDAVRFDKLRFVERILEERYSDASPAQLLEMGIACYTNRRRVGLNAMVRRARGISRQGRELPVKGEHVVCLRNQKTAGVDPIYNGMRGVLTSDVAWKPIYNKAGEVIGESEKHLTGAIEFPEDEVDSRSYEMLAAQFGREKTFQDPEELARETGIRSFSMAGGLFDFGYAMTAHKMQGSQYADLVVLAERPGPVDSESWKRWLYTAITRSASKLTVLR